MRDIDTIMAEGQQKPWKCPDPDCTYVGSPNIHLLNFPPKHVWSVAQVIHAWRGAPYPHNWKGSEGD